MRKNLLIIPLVIMLGCLGCETYTGDLGQMNDMSDSFVSQKFPWMAKFIEEDNEDENGPPNWPSKKTFFKNSKAVSGLLPRTLLNVKIYFDPHGTMYFLTGIYEARNLAEESKFRKQYNPINLPTMPNDLVDRVVNIFNRLITYENFLLTPENAKDYVVGLMEMTCLGAYIVDDSLSFIHYLPSRYDNPTGRLFLEAEYEARLRAAKKVKPMTVEFEDGLYHLHFFSYGGDIKEWKIMARPDGTIVKHEMRYPFGVDWDLHDYGYFYDAKHPGR